MLTAHWLLQLRMTNDAVISWQLIWTL